jgi:predicted RNase H-like HicB family nuclease
MEITFDENEQVYFVKYPDLPGCMMHGKTIEEAARLTEQVKNEWLKAAYEKGWKIPEPVKHRETTGRVTLRLPRYLHERIIEVAQEQGVSQNQLLVTYITQSIAGRYPV